MQRKIIGLYGILILANAAAWAWAGASFAGNSVLIGSAVLAYGLGLRHAVDADHIAAIDNVTRALMQKGQRPTLVGFFFSLGHSTIVLLACIALALTAASFKSRLDWFQSVGGTLGTIVSAAFLVAIALANAAAFRTVYRQFHDGNTAANPDAPLPGGWLTRLIRPALGLIRASWHMYPLGVLFGLGFDTATEIGLLGLSAVEGARGLPVWSILVFPALFTAGMCLVDTTDSILMLRAYGWAFADPARKMIYNMAVTGLSVAVALVVGGIELLGLIGDRFGLSGQVWDGIRTAGDHFGTIGYFIVALFIALWLGSMLINRLGRAETIA